MQKCQPQLRLSPQPLNHSTDLPTVRFSSASFLRLSSASSFSSSSCSLLIAPSVPTKCSSIASLCNIGNASGNESVLRSRSRCGSGWEGAEGEYSSTVWEGVGGAREERRAESSDCDGRAEAEGGGMREVRRLSSWEGESARWGAAGGGGSGGGPSWVDRSSARSACSSDDSIAG